MIALAWWRLSGVLVRHGGQAAALVGALLAVCAGVAVSWPSTVAMGETGSLQLFRAWSVVEWVAAAMAALWTAASPAGSQIEGETPAAGAHRPGPVSSNDDLTWEDWHWFGGLRPSEVTGGLALSGWTAGLGLAILGFPPGLFAAMVSGASLEDTALATLVGAASAAAGAAWGTTVLAGVPDGLRTTAALAILAGMVALGYAAVGPGRAPAMGPALLSLGATVRLVGALGALASAGLLVAGACVRRRLRTPAVEEDVQA